MKSVSCVHVQRHKANERIISCSLNFNIRRRQVINFVFRTRYSPRGSLMFPLVRILSVSHRRHERGGLEKKNPLTENQTSILRLVSSDFYCAGQIKILIKLYPILCSALLTTNELITGGGVTLRAFVYQGGIKHL
jgi:hypothetical protein